MLTDLLPDEPSDLELEPFEPGDKTDFDYEEIPATDCASAEDVWWEVFIPDEDECDPDPEPGDFWIESRGTFLRSGGRFTRGVVKLLQRLQSASVGRILC